MRECGLILFAVSSNIVHLIRAVNVSRLMACAELAFTIKGSSANHNYALYLYRNTVGTAGVFRSNGCGLDGYIDDFSFLSHGFSLHSRLHSSLLLWLGRLSVVYIDVFAHGLPPVPAVPRIFAILLSSSSSSFSIDFLPPFNDMFMIFCSRYRRHGARSLIFDRHKAMV